MSDKLSGSLQENLLTLLAFREGACSLVRNSVEVRLFTSDVYRDIVGRVYAYIDQFGTPPKEHLPDLFDDVLQNKEHKQYDLYASILQSAYELSAGINEQYVITQLEKFVRQQELKLGVVKASEAIQADDLDLAEVELEKALKTRLSLFDKGLTLETGLRQLSLKDELGDTVLLGIPELDKRKLGPTRRELWLFIAPPKRGKSWALARVAKQAMLQRWKVLVVTLEMSDELWCMRMFQTLFAVGKRKAEYVFTKFERDQLGRLIDLHREEKVPKHAFDNDKTFAVLKERLSSLHTRNNLIIKRFPTRGLTLNGLKAYLDALEQTENFIPDLLVLDYADLMRVDTRDLRVSLGTLFQDLRGMAVEHNFALATATQSNRAGASAKLLTDVHASEDFSKIATSDCVLTYNQTAAERSIGLARLFVANGRTDEDKFMILMAQAYATGQFCLDSIRMSDSYWQQIEDTARANPFAAGAADSKSEEAE